MDAPRRFAFSQPMSRGDYGDRLQLVEDYATVRRFPVLANLHVHQKSPTVLESGESIEVIFKQKNHTSPKSPINLPLDKKASPRRSRIRYNSRATRGAFKKPFAPCSPAKAKKATERKLASVHASSPYIPRHKVGVIPVAEQAKKYIGGTFVPAGNSNKKGCRFGDLFLHGANLQSKHMQVKFIKERSKRNLESLSKRHTEMLNSRTLDIAKRSC